MYFLFQLSSGALKKPLILNYSSYLYWLPLSVRSRGYIPWSRVVRTRAKLPAVQTSVRLWKTFRRRLL